VTEVKRSYDTSRRRAQAEATQREVVETAGRLFAAKGYAATTIDEIAAEAGVSRETIFKAFASKRQLLRVWVERAAAGPDEPVSIRRQEWVREIQATSDRRTQLELTATAVRSIHERTIDGIEVLRAAAQVDPEIAALWDEAQRRRRQDVRTVTRLLTASGPVKPALGAKALVDVVYVLTSPELYELYVGQCGWRPERYERWLAMALGLLALGPSEVDG
jgi:AcrR family transcriptional regulator